MLFPLFSVVEVLVEIGIVLSLSVSTLAGIITGAEVIFGMATGPKTAFGGATSRENILPLRVILLVPEILLMSESSSSELTSSAANPSYLIPW